MIPSSVIYNLESSTLRSFIATKYDPELVTSLLFILQRRDLSIYFAKSIKTSGILPGVPS
nr:MAG TPA: hypothetical protein [Caudoviricetes sp.]